MKKEITLEQLKELTEEIRDGEIISVSFCVEGSASEEVSTDGGRNVPDAGSLGSP